MSSTEELKQLAEQLLKTQWLNREEVEKLQNRQLAQLADYAAKNSEFFAEKLAANGLTANDISTIAGLKKLPVMTRRELQQNSEKLFCKTLPQGHAPASMVQTSGSSGEPVKVFRTAFNQLYWLAYGLREHIWHKRNALGKLAAIRANLSTNEAAEHNSWGPPIGLLFKTGTAYSMPINRNVSEQAAWLGTVNPDYILVYPNNIAALLDELAEKKIKLPALKQVRTIGETLSPILRQRIMDELGVSVADTYSSQEVGYIAAQCSEAGLYHIIAESLYVEILDENGNDCKPGQTGRVVVTDLNNYATPIFRYDIGDYAEFAGNCTCGRHGLPALKRISGRERNMVVVNGEKRWPLVGFHLYRDIAPIVQYQLIQKTAELVEVRLVSKEALSTEQEEKLSKVIRNSLGHEFALEFVYFETSIPRSASGKFDEFVCEYKP